MVHALAVAATTKKALANAGAFLRTLAGSFSPETKSLSLRENYLRKKAFVTAGLLLLLPGLLLRLACLCLLPCRHTNLLGSFLGRPGFPSFRGSSPRRDSPSPPLSPHQRRRLYSHGDVDVKCGPPFWKKNSKPGPLKIRGDHPGRMAFTGPPGGE